MRPRSSRPWRASPRPTTSLGGAERAAEISSPDVVLQAVSPTLHARDVLCPAAAWLAAERSLDELGPPVDAGELVRLSLPEAEVEAGKIQCEVLDLDRFGHIQLNVRETHMAAAGFDGSVELEFDSRAASVRAQRVATYSDLPQGEYAVILDHRHRVALVRNRANAAEAWASRSATRSGSPAPARPAARPQPRSGRA